MLDEVREREGKDRVTQVRGVDAVVVELLQREAMEGGVGLVRVRARVRVGFRVEG